jgi:predicted DsbA family dithiol-disulfide isomerase
MARRLRIDIVSDQVCPWCYVGKRRLEAALARRPDITAEIHWLPYQLSPDMPREGKDRAAHYASIFGPDRAAQIMAGMAQTGAAEGITFQTGPGARSPNTLMAHVLMLLAGETAGVDQNAVAEKLFAAHHTDSADLGSVEVLVGIASACGLDADSVRRTLESRAREADVQALIDQSRRMGVGGVPFFVLSGRYGVSGAQTPEVLLEMFEQALAAPSGH